MATATPTSTPVAPSRSGDTNCDELTDAIDAALVLQLTAALLDALPCPDGGDVNQDNVTNSIDAALILQFNAGLVPELPV